MATTPTPSQMAGHVDLSLKTPRYYVAHTAELQHDLEHVDWKLANHADTFGVTTGEATP